MRKTPIVLLASTALLAPTAALAGASEAATSGVSITVSNCSKTRYGTTVKIRISDFGKTARVRVSHPDGTFRFENDRVRRTASGVKYVGPTGGVSLTAKGNRPAFTIIANRPGKTQVVTTFKLRNGKSIFLSCTMR